LVSADENHMMQFLKQLHQVKFGEHDILIFPDIYALRNAYSRFCKKRLEKNEAIMILSYYDTIDGVRHFLNEVEVDVSKYSKEGSLVIIDGLKEFFHSETKFLSHLAAIEAHIKSIGKTGISVIIDMGLFYHGHKEDLIEFEKSVPVKADFTCKSLLCCYNVVDFETLSVQEQELVSGVHNKKLRV
jgi:hypothetical protein